MKKLSMLCACITGTFAHSMMHHSRTNSGDTELFPAATVPLHITIDTKIKKITSSPQRSPTEFVLLSNSPLSFPTLSTAYLFAQHIPTGSNENSPRNTQ